MFVVNAILHALQISFFMLWEVLWPLAFGFLLSAMIQTVVSKRAVASALGKPDLKGFVLACGFGAARLPPQRLFAERRGWRGARSPPP